MLPCPTICPCGTCAAAASLSTSRCPKRDDARRHNAALLLCCQARHPQSFSQPQNTKSLHFRNKVKSSSRLIILGGTRRRLFFFASCAAERALATSSTPKKQKPNSKKGTFGEPYHNTYSTTRISIKMIPQIPTQPASLEYSCALFPPNTAPLKS